MFDVFKGVEEFNFVGICWYIYFMYWSLLFFGYLIVGCKLDVVDVENLEGEDLGKGEIFVLMYV